MRKKPRTPILPIGLIPKSHMLVAGGGKTALRKVRFLLESGMTVRAIATDFASGFESFASPDLICINRCFEDSDIKGADLVYATTDDKQLNRHIVKLCRESGVLCCSVDKGWIDGDFISPAIIRDGEMSIAISSGGDSCRKSRMIKDHLARHLSFLGDGIPILIGTSHLQLSLKRREQLYIDGEQIEAVAKMLRCVFGLHEFAILQTCNRFELLAIASPDDTELLLSRIMGWERLAPNERYHLRGTEAFETLSLTLAGLHSQTPGENHIVAQYKAAIDLAVERKWANGIMRDFFAGCLRVSKKIREETREILHEGFEIEDVCAAYVKEQVQTLRESSVLVIGSGMVGRGMVNRLKSEAKSVTCLYRNNRPDFPASSGCDIRIGALDDIDAHLPDADVVIASTASDRPILDSGKLEAIKPGSYLIDLSLPRNIDPELSVSGAGKGLRIIDLDDLKHYFRRDELVRSSALDRGLSVLNNYREIYDKFIASIQGRNPAK